MALREKFGRLVLLDETEVGALGREYRAARLGPAGLDRLVTVLRFGPEVSSHAEATKRLIDEARLAARLQNPGLVRVLGIGRVEQSFYMSTELVEGRSVAAVLDRCRGEAFPFAADQALMVASRAASALESLHGRKDEAGVALLHGLVAPSRLVVAFDGEVKLKGLGLWPALRGTDLLPAEERRYLAPEQASGGAGEIRSDVYALGLVLFEVLTGRTPDGTDPLGGLEAASITNATGERKPMPRPLADLLRRALGREPDERFPSMADLRKAIDALVFSGDFAPTTFDIAFFMHTLFRDDMERETRSLEEARRGDYREFLAEDKPAVAAGPTPTTEPDPEQTRLPPAPAWSGPPPPEAISEMPPPTAVSRPAVADRPSSGPGQGPDASGLRRAAARATREAAARDAAARMTLGGPAAAPGSRRGLWLLLGLLGAVIVGGGAGFIYFVKLRGPASSPGAPSAVETEAAQARVRELETRIAQLEREKAAAEAKAAEDARSSIEAQAAAKGRAVDPAAVTRAQEAARLRARGEQERKQQGELGRLAAERTIEVQRLGAEATPMPASTPTPSSTTTPTPLPVAAPTPVAPTPVAAATPTPGPAATPTPALPPASTPAPAPEQSGAAPAAGAVAVGGNAAGTVPAPSPPGRVIADPSDPAVKLPVLLSEDKVPYPSRAAGRRISTSVAVRALVDEQGRVIETAVVLPSGQPPQYGFDEAALKRVRSRRYQPARRNGVPVAIWVVVRMDFRPPPMPF